MGGDFSYQTVYHPLHATLLGYPARCFIVDMIAVIVAGVK